MGPVAVDEPAARALAARPCFSESNLFSHEHGVQALLPFIALRLPPHSRAWLTSLPLDAGGRFGGNIVEHAVDTFDLVEDAVAGLA